jgi:hypothetical protein
MELKLRWATHVFYVTELSAMPAIPQALLAERTSQHIRVFRTSSVVIECPIAGAKQAPVATPRPTYNAEGHFCGILLKRSDKGILANWKSKWVSLATKEGFIEVREPPAEAIKPKEPRRYQLAEAFVDQTEVPNPELFTFAISGSFGRVHFATDNIEICTLWMLMVQDAVAGANPNRPVVNTVNRMRRRSLRSGIPLDVVIEKTHKMDSSGEDEEEAEQRRAASPNRKINESIEAWMYKKGNRTWHKRYVIVKKGRLSYCEVEPSKFVSSKHHLKTFVLDDTLRMEFLLDHAKKFPLSVRFGDQDHDGVILATSTYDDRIALMETLRLNSKLGPSAKENESYESTLMKRGDDALSTWKWKYVRLCGTTLTYAQTKNQTTGMKTIPLQGATIMQCEDITDTLFPFAMTGTFGRMFLASDTAEMRMLWGAILEDAIAFANPNRPVSESLRKLRLSKRAHVKRLLSASIAKNPNSICIMNESEDEDDADSSNASEDEVMGKKAPEALDAETLALIERVVPPQQSGWMDVYHGVGQPGKRLWVALLNGVISTSKVASAIDPQAKYPLRAASVTVLDTTTFSLEGKGFASAKGQKIILRAESEALRVQWENNIRLAVALPDPLVPMNRAVLEQYRDAHQARRYSLPDNKDDFSDRSDSDESSEPAQAYMLKRSKHGTQWHRRWVVVDVNERTFMTYKSHSSNDHAKEVPITATTIVNGVPATDDVNFIFCVDDENGEGTLFGTAEEADHKAVLEATIKLVKLKKL